MARTIPQKFWGIVIAVTHDRYFLDNVAGDWNWTEVRTSWEGNYSSWLEQKAKRLEQEEKQKAKEGKPLNGSSPPWIRMSPRKARQSKGKARLNAYDKLANEEVKEKESNLYCTYHRDRVLVIRKTVETTSAKVLETAYSLIISIAIFHEMPLWVFTRFEWYGKNYAFQNDHGAGKT